MGLLCCDFHSLGGSFLSSVRWISDATGLMCVKKRTEEREGIVEKNELNRGSASFQVDSPLSNVFFSSVFEMWKITLPLSHRACHGYSCTGNMSRNAKVLRSERCVKRSGQTTHGSRLMCHAFFVRQFSCVLVQIHSFFIYLFV